MLAHHDVRALELSRAAGAEIDDIADRADMLCARPEIGRTH